MDTGGHLRAWEDNDSTVYPLTSRMSDTDQRGRMALTPVHQTPTSTSFLPKDRTLPSLSSVFESNSLGSSQNRHPPGHDPGNPYPPENKPSTPSDPGLKRPRLSLDQGRRSGFGVSSDTALITIPVGSHGVVAMACYCLSLVKLMTDNLTLTRVET